MTDKAVSYPELPKPDHTLSTPWPAGDIVLFSESTLHAYADQAIAQFLERTGQYVTNDASREAAIAEAIDAAREQDRARVEAPIDSTIFDCGKAAGRQEVKDEQQCADFGEWIKRAYRDPESSSYTIHNMEVAYQAGRAAAPQAAVGVSDADIDRIVPELAPLPKVVLHLPDGDPRTAKTRFVQWEDGALHVCLNVFPAPAEAPANEGGIVAYLDIGSGGYMDIGTELSDEQLAALPKGRHMLKIAGTYGVDGWQSAALAASAQGVARSFTNELGNAIRITIEGPTSTSENVLTPVEASELRAALNEHAQAAVGVSDGTGAMASAWFGTSAPRAVETVFPVTKPEAPTQGDEAPLLDWLRENSCDLRCISVPTGGDDYDIHWAVIEHHMTAPHEREIGYAHEDDPAAAIRAARQSKTQGDQHEQQ